MHKDDIKKEIKILLKEASIYGWNDSKSKEYDRLQKEWEQCAHIDNKGNYIKAPEING